MIVSENPASKREHASQSGFHHRGCRSLYRGLLPCFFVCLAASGGCVDVLDWPLASQAVPDPQSPCGNGVDDIYPALKYSHIGSQSRPVAQVTVDTSSLASHESLDRLLPGLVRQSRLTLVPAGAPCDWRITFASSPPVLDAQAGTAWSASANCEDRYIVLSRSSGPQAEATLYASNERSALYALRAALALAAPDPANSSRRTVAEGTLVDYACFEHRGVVEGYYGRRYSDRDRSVLIRLMSHLRENTYIYAPKDDSYARWQWYKPYPPKEAQEIRAAAREAAENLVTFVWAITPAARFDPGSKQFGYSRLAEKLREMKGLGVNHFAVFMDDVLQFDAKRDIMIVNRVHDCLKEQGSDPHLIVIGAWYLLVPNGYTDALGRGLHPDIEILWTGSGIYTPFITRTDIELANRSFCRRVSIWDNWPPLVIPTLFSGRSADLPGVVRGFYSNPVANELNLHPPRQFWKTLGPIADYLWDSQRYSWASSYPRWQPILRGLLADWENKQAMTGRAALDEKENGDPL